MNPAHTEFMEVSGRRYANMRQRFGPLPFTLSRFREYLLDLLGDERGITRCTYCLQPLDILCLQLDHRIPPKSQGGSIGIDNLAPCCAPCNAQKGELRGDAFRALLMLVNNDPRLAAIGIAKFSEADRTNLLSRLQAQLKLAMREQARLAKAPGQQVRISPIRHSRRPA
jgi:hypothetical protein